MAAREPKLEMILEYVGPGKGPDAYQLWACRGEAKGCRKHQRKKRHCANCILPDENDTLEEVMTRLKRGDA